MELSISNMHSVHRYFITNMDFVLDYSIFSIAGIFKCYTSCYTSCYTLKKHKGSAAARTILQLSGALSVALLMHLSFDRSMLPSIIPTVCPPMFYVPDLRSC